MFSLFYLEGVDMINYTQTRKICIRIKKKKRKGAIKAKHRGKLRADVDLLRDNVIVQSAQIAVAESILALKCYAISLTHQFEPSDFYLLPQITPNAFAILETTMRSYVM